MAAIGYDLTLDKPVHCDPARIAQDDALSITVSNRGDVIPEELTRDLFRPFQRGAKARNEGLGLGLFVAASIAQSHKGRIGVKCEDGTTAFVLTLPLQENASAQ